MPTRKPPLGPTGDAVSAGNEVLDPHVPAMPVIMDYIDYRIYLRDAFEYIQKLNRNHSQRWIAKRAGFHSPQLLSMILKGQRQLAKDKVHDLAAVLKLDARSTEYLLLLIELSESTTHEAQSDILQKIQVGFRNGFFSPISNERAIIFKHWYYPAIREMVTLQDAPPDLSRYPAWVAEKLLISPEDAEEAIRVLRENSFLKEEEGRLIRSEPSVRTSKDQIYPMYLAAYHLAFMERAFSSVLLERDRRYFEGLTFAIPQSAFPEVKEAIQRFFREIDVLVEKHEKRETVCHIHLGLFPLSHWESAKKRVPST